MIWDILYIFVLMFFAISLLPLYFLFLRTYGRSKRAVIEGVSQLDSDALDRLGWTVREYQGLFGTSSIANDGWNAWGQRSMQQNILLQRVFLRGLPTVNGLPESTKKAARRYRLCLLAIVIFCVFFFVPSFVGLSRDFGEFTGTPNGIWYLLFGFFVGCWVFLPFEKFKKWPEIEDAQ